MRYFATVMKRVLLLAAIVSASSVAMVQAQDRETGFQPPKFSDMLERRFGEYGFEKLSSPETVLDKEDGLERILGRVGYTAAGFKLGGYDQYADIEKCTMGHHSDQPSLTKLAREIADKAADKRVVLINNQQGIALHHLFVAELSMALKEIGFTHLSIENPLEQSIRAFENSGEMSLPFLGIAIDTDEAKMFSLAHKTGFKFWSHGAWSVENWTGTRQQQRHFGQAQKVKQLLESDPNARILMLATISTSLERSKTDPETIYPAGYLREALGDQLMTIDQITGTHFREQYEPLDLPSLPLAMYRDLNGISGAAIVPRDKQPKESVSPFAQNVD